MLTNIGGNPKLGQKFRVSSRITISHESWVPAHPPRWVGGVGGWGGSRLLISLRVPPFSNWAGVGLGLFWIKRMCVCMHAYKFVCIYVCAYLRACVRLCLCFFCLFFFVFVFFFGGGVVFLNLTCTCEWKRKGGGHDFCFFIILYKFNIVSWFTNTSGAALSFGKTLEGFDWCYLGGSLILSTHFLCKYSTDYLFCN